MKQRLSLLMISGFMLLASAMASAQLPDFTELVKKSAPAVVNIRARENADQIQSGQNLPNEELFRFFGIPNPGTPPNRDRISGGTGFIISADGYILTNRHVVDGADKITVTLKDRRELEAEIIGEDEASDVALLKIDAKNLPVLKLGSVKDLEIGEWVMAIGSPLSFENSVTKGIVSAKGRRIRGQQYIPYIQSDVPINRGNSGGPLINMNGEVVAINTLIFSNTGGYMGISFSIPIDVAMNVADQLKENGVVKRGLLGVGIENVTQKMADYMGMKKPRGALVNQVSEDSAADKAGIQVGDVIVEFNGQEINTAATLPPIVGMVQPNTKVNLTVFRDGKNKRITAKLDALDETVVAGDGGQSEDVKAGIGFSVSKLSEQDKSRTGESSGVIVTDITDRDVQRAQLQVGDVIKKVNKKPIKNLSDFSDAIDALKDDEPLVLLVKQGPANRFIVIERNAE